MNSDKDLVICTRGLTKSYNGRPVLKSLDLKVPRNSIFGFLGPNGAGKSTTIKLLLGLIKPTAGSGTVFGLDIARDSAEIRRRIGYLPQNPRYYDYMTARETLRFTAGFFYKGPAELVERRVDETLRMTGLDDKADRKIKGFSGGELQRLGIAQAQINNPDLLILDEPAASLDPMGRRDVLEVMRSLKNRTTIFYSTHILDDVQRVSDTVAILNKGTLIAMAPIEDLLTAREGVVYKLVLAGNPAGIRSTLTTQPWISSVTSTTDNGHSVWNLTITDEKAAERQLLRLLLRDETIAVKEFSRERYDLEDVFMRFVQEEKCNA
ncbi:ABC transporter ATP-binding protein [Methanocella arvoryzae]|uniref:ABC-type transport system, ATPase component n=1 Tax=Methanocella arvoryzae (strain DSM 22066 / NBRC 105507 / MRE50) TaxID=351160 RepID=Q0W7S8_METAR|nr:ABC transporter ATP-binding protein [Methanocella arvoryzae]CAJ35565.1 ABC-type transport system, ATPase component [Methanocella arvoryzae MRE50]